MKNLPRILKNVSREAANQETTVTPLITQPLREFHQSLMSRIQERAEENARKAAEREWRFQVGDRVLTPKGQVLEVKNHLWVGGSKPGPRYMMERVDVQPDQEGHWKGHTIPELMEAEQYQLMSGPRKDFAGGGLARVAKAMSGPRPKKPGIIKEVGGNWETSENLPHRMSQAHVYDEEGSRAEGAVNQWIDGPLTKYVKSTMGTIKDPVRQRIDKNLPMHIPVIPVSLKPPKENLQAKRAAKGYPEQGVATTLQGSRWEDLVDNAIDVEPLSQRIREYGIQTQPWMENVDPNTPIHSLSTINIMNQLGFTHLADELYNSLRRGTDIPVELRLNPKQLKGMGLEQAIDHVSKINAWRQARAAEAANAKLAPAIETIREFPDQYKWVKIRKGPDVGETYDAPGKLGSGDWERLRHRAEQVVNDHLGTRSELGDQEWLRAVNEHQEDLIDDFTKTNTVKRDLSEDILAQALEAEGRNMKNCVGGYCDKVLSGRSEIYSLRDPEGNPHVTVEMVPGGAILRDDIYQSGLDKVWDKKHGEGSFDDLLDSGGPLTPEEANQFLLSFDDDYDIYSWLWQNRRDLLDPSWGDSRPSIHQVYGSANSDPKPEYHPYIREFIENSGNKFFGHIPWNSGLTKEEIANFTNREAWLEHLKNLNPE